MRYLALVAILVVASPLHSQTDNIRVTVASSLQRGTPVRVAASYGRVPRAVRAATIEALGVAGFTVLTKERRRPQELVLVLSARCQQDPKRTWRCAEYAARLVDRDGVDVRASVVASPLAKPATAMRDIQQAMASGWLTDG